ncbi:DUF3810 domain-containing protein [Pollutibacter soli]|uniref:DUF3810 domain-containing protein n=1 Tax=Pollutibacter soli TaxID=3034157 RepID=UPI003013554A
MKPARSFTGEIVFTSVLLLGVFIIRIIASNRFWVEEGYTFGLYQGLSVIFRYTWGWVPFSIGDLLYIGLFIWLVVKLLKFIKILARKKFSRASFLLGGFRYFRLAIWIYLIFNIFWGLNYNRPGIAYQLALDVKKEPVDQLRKLTLLLLDSTNACSGFSEWKKNLTTKQIFSGADLAYQQVSPEYPFLKYQPASVKKSLFGVIGNYMGYSGYFNPFTGEAQVNHTVPIAVLPFVTCHEIAHQLGYAKENEANFVGFLAAEKSGQTAFRYSAYFEMFLYANSELYLFDTAAYRANMRALAPEAKADLVELRAFRIKYEGPVDKAVSAFYDRYLKLNQQPSGEKSYSRVIMWLLAYYRKEGKI